MKFGISFCIILCVVCFGVNGQNGRPCETPNGEMATCTSIYSCSRLLNVVKSRDQLQIQFLKKSQCGYNNGPLVCCGERTNYISVPGRRVLTKTVNAYPVGDGGRYFRYNQLLPDRPRCGQDFSDKIFGGEATAINEFPWMVLLQYENSMGQKKWACGGTLINDRYVLTAAHCVIGDILTKVGRLVNIRVGEYNTETAKDCVNSFCNNPEDVDVEEIMYHEGYENSNVNRYDDIALVRLRKSVTFTGFVQPICLPHIDELGQVGDRVVVSGWGRTEYSNRSPMKLKVEVQLSYKSQCARTFASAGVTLKSTQVCAGGQRGKDSCAGDSGGPLMKTVSDDASTWYQEGIVSFGAKCGTEGWPGIYTRVESYLNWIHSNVRQ